MRFISLFAHNHGLFFACIDKMFYKKKKVLQQNDTSDQEIACLKSMLAVIRDDLVAPHQGYLMEAALSLVTGLHFLKFFFFSSPSHNSPRCCPKGLQSILMMTLADMCVDTHNCSNLQHVCDSHLIFFTSLCLFRFLFVLLAPSLFHHLNNKSAPFLEVFITFH